MALYSAGLDWSGTPYRKERGTGSDFYIPCVVGFACPLEKLEETLKAVKAQVGLPQSVEIHAHHLPEEMQAAFLQAALNLEIRVGARIIEKGTAENPRGNTDLPLPADFAAEAALSVFARFIPMYEISRLWYDKDIQGQQREKEFETAVKRLNREHGWNSGMKARSKESHKSDLIQVADVVAYGLRRLAMNAIENATMRRLVVALREDTSNTIVGPEAWSK